MKPSRVAYVRDCTHHTYEPPAPPCTYLPLVVWLRPQPLPEGGAAADKEHGGGRRRRRRSLLMRATDTNAAREETVAGRPIDRSGARAVGWPVNKWEGWGVRVNGSICGGECARVGSIRPRPAGAPGDSLLQQEAATASSKFLVPGLHDRSIERTHLSTHPPTNPYAHRQVHTSTKQPNPIVRREGGAGAARPGDPVLGSTNRRAKEEQKHVRKHCSGSVPCASVTIQPPTQSQIDRSAESF